MAWESESDRALLLELRLTGAARRRTAQQSLLEMLERQGWVVSTPRADEVELVAERVVELDRMLDGRWKGWRAVAHALLARELPPTVRGLKELRRLEREPPPIPARVSLKTATSQVAEHSKASLHRGHLEMLGGAEVVRDGTVLMRPHAGTKLRRGSDLVDASQLVALQGIVALTQRALLDGTRVVGPRPGAVMTVENESAFVDLPKPDGLLLVWIPGWNTHLAVELLRSLPEGRRLHFGDLDVNGVRIYRHLRERLPDLEHFVPEWWAEVAAEAPPWPVEWPEGLVRANDPQLLRDLAAKGLGSEQEVVVLDGRMVGELEQAVGPGPL